MHRHLAFGLTVAACALAVSSCGDSTSSLVSESVVGIRVSLAGDYNRSVELEPGDSIRVGAVAVDAAGDSVPGTFPIALQSRNPAVARLDSSDFVHVIGDGLTYIVGSLTIDGATMKDSMLVFAGVPVSGP